MLGESGMGRRMVSQAAWVRSLLASFIKSWENRRSPIGGLFGSVMGEHSQVLPWDLAEQAAFIIYAGRKLRRPSANLKRIGQILLERRKQIVKMIKPSMEAKRC